MRHRLVSPTEAEEAAINTGIADDGDTYELTPAEFWQLRSEISDSLRAKVARLTTAELAQVKQEVEQRLQPFCNANHLSLPAQVILTSGSKPT